jgi:hypothetical protein
MAKYGLPGAELCRTCWFDVRPPCMVTGCSAKATRHWEPGIDTCGDHVKLGQETWRMAGRQR